MPKVLTMVPAEGESTEEFAARAAGQVTEFFGEAAEAAPPDADTEENGLGWKPGDDKAEPAEEPTEAALIGDLAKLFATFGRGPGWVTNPEETRRLHKYWVRGEGAAKIRWGEDGDFARCERLVGEKIGENDPAKLRFIKQICAQWHKDATGATPGNAPGEGD